MSEYRYAIGIEYPQNALTSEQTDRLAEAFEGLETRLGEGFSPRRTMDCAVLNALDIPSNEQDELLGRLYPMLLNKLVTLKRMMG